jgi:pimeloyl-ACP methyl ester carboxylesterase
MKRKISMLILWLVFSFAFTSGVQAQGTLPRFERSDCPIEVPSEPPIECGYLVTLEDYDNPESREIRTAVIIIRSRNENPSKDALLFTEGGPGYSSLRFVWWLADIEFANDRDIVILEQRGNIFSEPSLACDFSIWSDGNEGQTPCLDSLQQAGIDLEHYSTAFIAADINALKQVLDYENWDLFGTSYSTRLMQLVMSRYPQGVRSVVLHSISPVTDTRYQHDPEHAARALQVMLADCAADPACSGAYPDLESQFYALVQKLNDKPVGFDMTIPQSSERFTLEVNGDSLINWMVGSAFYAPAYPPHDTAYLPLLIDQLSHGNTDLLYPWAKSYVSRWTDDSFAWGLFFAVNCQDDAPFITSEMVEAQTEAYPELDGYYRQRAELAICAAWGLDGAPPLATEPVTSDIPTLVLAGTYDPITPPEWSRTAITNLSKTTFVEFPSLGHSVLSNSPCAEHITAAFLDNPAIAPDLSCVAEAPEPKFVLPNEIIIAPAIYEIHYGELGYSQLEENLFLGSWLTLIGTGVVAVVAGLVKLVRRSKQPPSDPLARIALPLLIGLAVTVLVWGYALRFTLQSNAATMSNVFRFGLPVAYWWLFVIVILIGLMTIALIAMTVLAWIRKYGSILGRIATSLTTLAAITFSGVLAKWGLFTALFR